MNERVGVIGGGPAGLAAAYTLGTLGAPADVFEAGSTVGGMARTIGLWGQKVDLGPHRFFSLNARANRLWLDIVGTEYRMIERQSRIFYNQDHSLLMGILVAEKIALARHHDLWDVNADDAYQEAAIINDTGSCGRTKLEPQLP